MGPEAEHQPHQAEEPYWGDPEWLEWAGGAAHAYWCDEYEQGWEQEWNLLLDRLVAGAPMVVHAVARRMVEERRVTPEAPQPEGCGDDDGGPLADPRDWGREDACTAVRDVQPLLVRELRRLSRVYRRRRSCRSNTRRPRARSPRGIAGAARRARSGTSSRGDPDGSGDDDPPGDPPPHRHGEQAHGGAHALGIRAGPLAVSPDHARREAEVPRGARARSRAQKSMQTAVVQDTTAMQTMVVQVGAYRRRLARRGRRPWWAARSAGGAW